LLQNEDFDINDLVNNRKLQGLINPKERRISQREREVQKSAQAYQKQLKINKIKKEREEKQAKIDEERAAKEAFNERIDNAYSATSLLNEFYSNEIRANRNFKNKRIDIKGTIYTVVKDDYEDKVKIILNAPGVGSVICFTDESEAVAQLSSGRQVVLEATCVGLDDSKVSLYFMETDIIGY